MIFSFRKNTVLGRYSFNFVLVHNHRFTEILVSEISLLRIAFHSCIIILFEF